jgi:hypothetical protein
MQQSSTSVSPEQHIALAIQQAIVRGHKMTQPYDNGDDYLMSVCRNCGMLALASGRVMMGRALTFDCEHHRPSNEPAPNARPTLSGKHLPLRILDDGDLKLYGYTEPYGSYCEHCGNGTTIVGTSCSHCSGAGRSHAIDKISRRPKPYIRTDRDKQNILHAIAPAAKHTGGRIWYRYAEQHARQPATHLTAPCGAQSEVAVVYLPREYNPEGNERPDRLVQYCCHEECFTITYPRNRIITTE